MGLASRSRLSAQPALSGTPISTTPATGVSGRMGFDIFSMLTVVIVAAVVAAAIAAMVALITKKARSL